MFRSSTHWVTVMKNAEAQLIEYALSKFGDKEEATAEIIDTPIPSSVVPFKNPAQSDPGRESLTIHGTKVVYHGSGGSCVGQEQNDNSSAPLVVLHGYAAASLHFYRNLFGLAKHGFGTVYALDLLGFGLSSRPRFELANDSVEATETFFVESLEAWRKARGIPKMILAGHSMGGYLSVAYTEKYPQHVDRLILLSPVGVPHRVEQDDSNNSPSCSAMEEDDTTTTSAAKELPPLTYFQRVWKHLWDYHRLSYGTIAHYMFESVGRVATNFTLGDYMTPTERKVVTDYLYSNMVLPTSGDHAINYILTSRYYARKPTVYRIPKLIRNHQIPVAFIYGDRDIMPVEGGLEVRSRCCSSSTNSADNQHLVQIFVINDAGHALNWKHPEEFNTAVLLAGGMQVPPDMPQPRIIVGEY